MGRTGDPDLQAAPRRAPGSRPDRRRRTVRLREAGREDTSAFPGPSGFSSGRRRSCRTLRGAVAADLRPGGDGKRLAKLELVAGLTAPRSTSWCSGRSRDVFAGTAIIATVSSGHGFRRQPGFLRQPRPDREGEREPHGPDHLGLSDRSFALTNRPPTIHAHDHRPDHPRSVRRRGRASNWQASLWCRRASSPRSAGRTTTSGWFGSENLVEGLMPS